MTPEAGLVSTYATLNLMVVSWRPTWGVETT